jgi:hypothetical protein
MGFSGYRLAAVVMALLCVEPRAGAQTPPPGTQPRGQMPALGRPTQAGDPLPLLDFDAYFLGTWTFEGTVPDNPLGPGGSMSGRAVFAKSGEGQYEASIAVQGPKAPFTIKERIEYHKDDKVMTRQVTDSRGFSYTQRAPVGADLGGLYYIYFESDPFTAGGRTVRLKDSLRLVSPANFRVTSTISVDGERYTNLGNPWWRKQQ